VARKIELAWFLVLASSLVACSKASPPPSTPVVQQSAPIPAPEIQALPIEPAVTPARPTNAGAVKTEMRHVLFHFTDTAVVRIDTLSGELVPTGKNEMPVFDDKKSFELRVTSATIAITPQSLGEILSTFVFAKPDAPLREISAAIDKDKLIIRGKLNNKGLIPFKIVGTLSASPDGRLSIHTEKVKALHVPVKGMMDLFGVDLANVVNTSKIDGMEVDKDDLLMDLGKLLPAPHIIGKVTAVRLGNGSIVTTMGSANEAALLATEKGGSMTFHGNPVRFGKFIMENADLTILAMDPTDLLDWNQDRYRDQLVAGYSKITPNFGLRAYVKDFAKLSRSSAASVAAVPKN
jgi:hypothetical protein